MADDAAAAWAAMTATRVRHLVDESHFTVRVTACAACGQRSVVVFTERIDWSGGDDDQTWLAVPVDGDELARLEAADEGAVGATLTAMVAARRFVVRSYPTGGAISCSWRDGGFAIGPHD